MPWINACDNVSGASHKRQCVVDRRPIQFLQATADEGGSQVGGLHFMKLGIIDCEQASASGDDESMDRSSNPCDRMPDLLDNNLRIWRSKGDSHISHNIADSFCWCIKEMCFFVCHIG